MGCFLTIINPEEDTPLDQAVYSATRNKIFAVRGGYVFRFDANGVKEAQARFVSNFFPVSSIAYSDIDDKVYCSVWNDEPRPNDHSDVYSGIGFFRLIYRIDPDTLGLVGTPISPFTNFNASTGVPQGCGALVYHGGFLYALARGNMQNASGFGFNATCKIDPGPGTTIVSNVGGTITTFEIVNDICADTVNGLIWCSAPTDVQAIACLQFSDDTNPSYVLLIPPAGPGELSIHGITHDPIQNRVYAVTRTNTLAEFDVTNPAAPALTQRTIPGTNPQPVKVKWNTYDQLVYIADWPNDAVVVYDPLTTLFTVKTGFDSPWDCVFTQSKKFAVQQSGVGLKEIT